eukprot:4753138-Prymnesium_polylepis.3
MHQWLWAAHHDRVAAHEAPNRRRHIGSSRLKQHALGKRARRRRRLVALRHQLGAVHVHTGQV